MEVIPRHMHKFVRHDDKFIICSLCKMKKLRLFATDDEGRLEGTMSNGQTYSVRKHRKAWFYPDVWLKVYEALAGWKAKLTAQTLLQTGARINETRYIEERDVDYDRNTIRLRITKTKARKAGEERGSPRTIPINSKFMKELKKIFKTLPEGSKLPILSTAAFNISLKKAMRRIGLKDWYMYSCHNIRKTHGNWLKILKGAGIMKIDSDEICLRLGHDHNTYLRDYGSSSVLNPQDTLQAKEIMGDLYQV
jgi:integrase